MAVALTRGLTGRRGNPGTKGRLLGKSLEAYVLSLETINRLTITYRTETFCALVCNAWELLLKAKMLDGSTDRSVIYYTTKPGERKRTKSLRDCLVSVFPNENDSVRRNLERVEDFRDAAIHLFITDVPKDVLGLFQACVLNYHRCLDEWFGVSLSDRIPVGMMTIVFDTNPERLDLSSAVMRRRLGKDAAEYLLGVSEEIRAEHEETGFSHQFAVQIQYGLTIQDNATDAAVVAVTGPGGRPARTLEVPRDPAKQYPFRQTELIDQINARLQLDPPLNKGAIQSVIRAYGIHAKREYFYQGAVKGSPGQYSQRFVDWFVTRYQQPGDFVAKARDRVRAMNVAVRAATPADLR